LKDNLLFDALIAKMQGKNVGIPQCEGAAVMKSPWNAAGKPACVPPPLSLCLIFKYNLWLHCIFDLQHSCSYSVMVNNSF
jgi:hypothetical protein